MSTITPVLNPAVRVERRLPGRVPGRVEARVKAGSAQGTVRLTRRGRLVLLVLSLAVVAAVALTLAAGSAATGQGGDSGAVEVVTVAPGDTLWGLASDVAASTGQDDVRDVMEHIQELNTLDSSVVFAGQQLRVPAE
ncbi:MAG: LysM peptidoglycan-binding domain-containing protein [Nocardioidaceae bacterium]|nr:LysM peptidoglycan-binding domain-containing protein [Nocardioidaceae bacterium]